jgi:hypothetical protein
MAQQQEQLNAMQSAMEEKKTSSALTSELQEALNAKANVSEVVTKASLQSMLAAASMGML